ncbi:MAG: hypothetical protein JXQ67_11345 [Campylobacterales bacterium]|nr:hypothetical protein [Campylobacterales bacterium]
MSWLDFLQTKKECLINFGRGIYAQIAPNEEELFNSAYEAFEKGEILEGYKYFLHSLVNYNNATANENIILVENEKSIEFTLFQGSAKIKGIITPKHLNAEVTLVKKDIAPVALKRKVLERNYQFTYVNYMSDAEFIKLKLYQDNITMNPQKIFFPLRELALNADFDKEFIVSEFPECALEEIEHLEPLNEVELQIKYSFLQKWIEELEAKIPTLPTNDNAGMQAFLYLNILFKIDYLLVPKYKMYQRLSKKIQSYFGDESSTMETKNEELKRYITKLQSLSFEEFSKNFYNAKYTFNPIDKSSYEEFCTFISESMVKIRWYKNNRYTLIVPTIYTYMAFYSLYNYGLNNVVKELLHVYVSVTNSDFFKALECPTLYDEIKESFYKRNIAQAVDEIITKHQKQYRALRSFSNELNFNSMNDFSYSYYQSLKNMNFEEI